VKGGTGVPDGLAVAGWSREPHWGVYAALLLSSAALLTLEISLTRFFSYTIWYHFAYLTISVAMLGFGASGAIVAAFPGLFARHGQKLLVVSLLAAAVATILGLVFVASHPIQVEKLTTAPARLAFNLLVYYVVVGTPFLLAGFSVGVPFAAWPSSMGRLYFWDLVGAALGCAFVAAGIELLTVPGLIFAASGLMLLSAAALTMAAARRMSGLVMAGLGFAVLACSSTAGERLPIVLTGSKTLPQMIEQSAMVRPDAPPFEQRTDRFTKWTAINRVDAFGWEYPSGFAYWAGLGLSSTYQWPAERPRVACLNYDGSNGSDVYGSKGDIQREFAFLEFHQLRLPYLLLEQPKVLAIGVGGGIDLFNAVKQGARHVTGVEIQPETVKLLRDRLFDFNNGFFRRDDVRLEAGEGRHFVRKSDETYDLVQITTVDTFAAQAAGAYVLAESYLYTVEAFEDYFRRLGDDGIVSVVIGDYHYEGHPPSLATRIGLIGYRALERRGSPEPSRHLLIVAAPVGPDAHNLVVLVKKSPFTPDEVGRIKDFASKMLFSVVFEPGGSNGPLDAFLGPDEATRAKALEAGLFDVGATYDDDPFFYNVGKLKNLSPEKTAFFSLPGSFMGQVVLILMVVQSILIGSILVFAPLLLGAREGLRGPGVASYLAYFLSLGVGFMFVEISFVQKFVLFLGSPTYALSVTIFSLLLFSGIGSLLSTRLPLEPEAALRRLVPIVAAVIVLYAFGLSHAFDATLHLDIAARILIAVLAQMPVGLLLGMFMPLGIACVARENPRLVPWAWGVNGVGSVAGTTLAVLLAMVYGFRAVSLVAACLYLVGTFLMLRTTAALRRA
jgi:hypothetical protein